MPTHEVKIAIWFQKILPLKCAADHTAITAAHFLDYPLAQRVLSVRPRPCLALLGPFPLEAGSPLSLACGVKSLDSVQVNPHVAVANQLQLRQDLERFRRLLVASH